MPVPLKSLREMVSSGLARRAAALDLSRRELEAVIHQPAQGAEAQHG